MQERILLPPKTRVFERDGWYLYFDPSNFLWVRVNASGHFLMQRFRRFRTIPQVAQDVARAFPVGLADAETSVQAFVDKMVESGFLHRNLYREKEKWEFEFPDFAHDLYLHLTNDCNLQCPYCYNKSDREYKIMMAKKGRFAPILSTEEYKALIARVIELGVKRLLFTGGEPLMRKDALELMAHARSLSPELKIEVLTNAILINEQVAEKLCQVVDTVTISLDGHERHLHEHYRGRNTFAPTVKGIRALVEMRNRAGRDGKPMVALVPALTDRNIGFMKEIYEFCLDELGGDMLAPILFQAGDHQELSLSQIPTLQEWTEAQERTSEYLRERARRKNLPARKSDGVGPRFHCGVGSGEFSVDASGYVYPCQSLHFDEFICGNVRDDDIKKIYDDSKVMRKVRSTVVDRLTVCSHCNFRYLCNGGCRATAYHVYRNFDAHNEIYCRHLEKLAVDRLWGSSDMPLYSTESACV